MEPKNKKPQSPDDGRLPEAFALKWIKASVLPDRITTAWALTALSMLALGTITFTCNRLFIDTLESAGVTLPVSGFYLYVAIVAALASLALLRIWNDSRLRIIMYMSFVLYLPSVISLSGIDMLAVAGWALNLSLFSSDLPPSAIAVSGIVLACGGLLLESFSHMKKAQENLLRRGADKAEVEHVLYKNVIFEAKLIIASAAAVLLIATGVPVVVPAILWVLRSAGFMYVMAGLGAALILGLIVVIYVKPIKW
jgi:hypothetical protein